MHVPASLPPAWTYLRMKYETDSLFQCAGASRISPSPPSPPLLPPSRQGSPAEIGENNERREPELNREATEKTSDIAMPRLRNRDRGRVSVKKKKRKSVLLCTEILCGYPRRSLDYSQRRASSYFVSRTGENLMCIHGCDPRADEVTNNRANGAVNQ